MPRTKPAAAALMASSEDAEQQFYEALQRGDIEQLMACWSDDDEIVCVVPGGLRAVGAAAIRSLYETLFAQGTVHVQLEEPKRVINHSAAVHSVLERVQIEGADGVHTGWAVATNVFVKTAEGWRLVAHHVGPVESAEAPVAAPPDTVWH